MSKYVSALSDYLGRKPLLVMSCSCFALSRVILIYADSEGVLLLVAALAGIFDVTYPVCQAWLCDLLPKKDLGRGFGLLTGIGFGLGFSIGLPGGAILAQKVSPNAAIWVSIVLQVVNAFLVIFCPIEDTYGIRQILREGEAQLQIASQKDGAEKEEKEKVKLFKSHPRRLPEDWKAFLYAQNPLSAFPIILQARDNVYDWYSYIFAQMCQRVLQNNLILFMQAIIELTQAAAGAALCFVGIGVAVFAPLLLARYHERGLFFFGTSLQIIAYTILGAAAALVDVHMRLIFLIVSLLLVTVGAVWISALQTILVSQYSADMQGEVLGVLAELGEICIAFAYPVGALFSYTLKENTKIPWSGIIWMCSVLYLVVALAFQFLSNPAADVIKLVRRNPMAIVAAEEAPVATGLSESENVKVSYEKSQSPVYVEYAEKSTDVIPQGNPLHSGKAI